MDRQPTLPQFTALRHRRVQGFSDSFTMGVFSEAQISLHAHPKPFESHIRRTRCSGEDPAGIPNTT
jgi:hypothetical protein